jgi:hypothetical protein
MVDKVADKLPAWEGRLMHRSDRLALIKSTLVAMHVYITITITLPGWLLKVLEKIMKGFLWSDTEVVQSNKCTVAWGQSATPIATGRPWRR